MSIDIEMKELIEKRKREREKQAQTYIQGSPQLKNALSDLR